MHTKKSAIETENTSLFFSKTENFDKVFSMVSYHYYHCTFEYIQNYESLWEKNWGKQCRRVCVVFILFNE